MHLRIRPLSGTRITAHLGVGCFVGMPLSHYDNLLAPIAHRPFPIAHCYTCRYDQGRKILIEGANATMLDIDFGTYPCEPGRWFARANGVTMLGSKWRTL